MTEEQAEAQSEKARETPAIVEETGPDNETIKLLVV